MLILNFLITNNINNKININDNNNHIPNKPTQNRWLEANEPLLAAFHSLQQREDILSMWSYHHDLNGAMNGTSDLQQFKKQLWLFEILPKHGNINNVNGKKNLTNK